jgi:hypothetical protein
VRSSAKRDSKENGNLGHVKLNKSNKNLSGKHNQVEDRIAEIDVKIELLYSARNKNNIHV